MLIELAITHAIDTIEKATEKNVSEKVTGSVYIKEALVPGNVVALGHDTNNQFLNISGANGSYGGFTVGNLSSKLQFREASCCQCRQWLHFIPQSYLPSFLRISEWKLFSLGLSSC
jgi:hypothetical protein